MIMKQNIDYKTLKDLFFELEQQSKELIQFGNSKEQSEGNGMKKVIDSIYNYCKKNKIKI